MCRDTRFTKLWRDDMKGKKVMISVRLDESQVELIQKIKEKVGVFGGPTTSAIIRAALEKSLPKMVEDGLVKEQSNYYLVYHGEAMQAWYLVYAADEVAAIKKVLDVNGHRQEDDPENEMVKSQWIEPVCSVCGKSVLEPGSNNIPIIGGPKDGEWASFWQDGRGRIFCDDCIDEIGE